MEPLVVPTLHPYECFASLPAVLDSFLMPVCGTILLTTAIDRFMCVVKPVWYGYAGAEFAYGIQLMATVLAMPSILAQYLTAIFGDFRNAFVSFDDRLFTGNPPCAAAKENLVHSMIERT